LIIPPGFFEDDIKIRVGYNDHLDGWTTLNPAAQFLYSAHPHGVDYRWVYEDVPLFWQERITEIDLISTYDVDLMRQARNAAFLAATRIPMHCYSTDFDHTGAAPAEWFRNHLL
jgi:hypothetical protein